MVSQNSKIARFINWIMVLIGSLVIVKLKNLHHIFDHDNDDDVLNTQNPFTMSKNFVWW